MNAVLVELLKVLPLIADRQQRVGTSPSQRRVDTATCLRIIQLLLAERNSEKAQSIEAQEGKQ